MKSETSSKLVEIGAAGGDAEASPVSEKDETVSELLSNQKDLAQSNSVFRSFI
jgi:hypothetical protein